MKPSTETDCLFRPKMISNPNGQWANEAFAQAMINKLLQIMTDWVPTMLQQFDTYKNKTKNSIWSISDAQNYSLPFSS